MKRQILLASIFFAFFVIPFSSIAQDNMGVGTQNPDSTSILELSSNEKGILIPRMDSMERNAIQNPATGLMVYDTDYDQFWYFDGTQWVRAIGPQGPQGPQGPSGSASIYSTKGTTDISKAPNTGYTNISNMSLTFTPSKSEVIVHFSASGTYTGTYTPQQFVSFRILVNGSPVNGQGFSCSVGEYDDFDGVHNIWGGSISVPVSVNAGSSNTLSVQWDYQSNQTGNSLLNYAGSQDYSNRSLVVFE